MLANGGGPNVVNRTLSTAGSVSGTVTLDMTKDQIKQFVLSGNTVLSASAVSVNGAQLLLLADQPASGGPFTLGISDGTVTLPVTDPGWTAGKRMIVLVVWSSPTTYTAVVMNVATAPAVPTAPGQVTGLTATPGNAQAILAWTAPANGGSAITDALIEQSPDGTTWTPVAHAALGTATTYTVTGLTNGTLLHFRVSAVNAIGTGATSAEQTVTPGVPLAPTGLAVTPGDAQVSLSWTAPAGNGTAAITTYKVEHRGNPGGGWVTFVHSASTATTIVVTGLANNALQDFQVSAVNAAGTGAPSAAVSATPVPAGSAYDTAVLADSPVSYWKLGETSGTVAADSAGSNPGTYTGGVTLAAAGPGSQANAASFNGTDGYVAVPFSAGLQPASVTDEIWVYLPADPGAGKMFMQSNAGTPMGHVLGHGITGAGESMFGSWFSGSWHNTGATTALTFNAWHHLAGTYDGTTLKIYVDGSEVASAEATWGGPLAYAAGEFRIARDYANSFTAARFARAAVYSTALSAARIAAHFAAS